MDEIEQQYQDLLGVEFAIWLPSARYGITRSIQQNVPQEGTVVCPVFNCGAVFHAASECGRPVQFIDCSANSFLVDTSVRPAPYSAVILSEMFGHRFSAEELNQPLVSNAAYRVFDMAMAIPTADDMHRMKDSDVTVLSFGLGKSLYSGWGGMALTHCQQTAIALQKHRDTDLTIGNVAARTKWNAQLIARTLAHEPLVYRKLRELKQRSSHSEAAESSGFSRQSREWHRPPTGLTAALSARNLDSANSYAFQRIQLSAEYANQLSSISNRVQLPQQIDSALSHYSIRIPGDLRESIRQQLWNSGIDVGSLFPFPHHLANAEDFPNAHQASREVMNLPLSNQLTKADVRRICDCLKRELEASCSQPQQRRVA